MSSAHNRNEKRVKYKMEASNGFAHNRVSVRVAVLLLVLSCYVKAQGLQQSGGAGLCTTTQATANRIFIQDVPESTAVGTILIHLKILGTDTEVRLRVLKGDRHIRFDPASRNLTLDQALDREVFSSVEVELGCIILATEQEIKLPVNILILDVNDNPPVFQKLVYSANVSELTPTGTTVIRNIEATDKDVENWYITYEIVPGPFSDYFNIPNPAKGEVLLQKSLDFEKLNLMTFKVKAKDNHDGGQPLDSLTTITVYIFDGDDQNPRFMNSAYRAIIEESTATGSDIAVLPPLQAVDQDLGINASIVYSIVPTWAGGSYEHFAIDAITAQVTLSDTTDIKRGQTHPVLIRATQEDNADRYATTLLHITVAPANENPPRFPHREYTTQVVENSPVGSVVLTLQASDNDEGAKLTYTFGPGPTSGLDFELDQLGGVLKTRQPLDYERQSQYRLKIQVTDGTLSDETTVIVQVVNMNDNPPIFSQPVSVFSAPFEEGATIGRLKAYDLDPVTKMQYYFKDNITLFSISNEGDIIIKGTKNDFTQNQYRLFVVASDNGMPALEGCAVAVVNFSPGPVGLVSGASSGADQMNFMLVIIFGVLCGFLLMIIIILAVYIYKSRLKAGKPKNDFVRSQSFESRLNMNRDQASRTYLDDTDGLAFKTTKAHHLAMYNDIPIDPDATSPQDNPFVPDDTISQYTSINSNNHGFRSDSQDINDNMNKHYSSGSSIDLNKRMNAVNEIEYDSALTPMTTEHGGQSAGKIPSPPSAHSSFQSLAGSMSTFRAGGSTQRLMTPRGTPKGSINKKPQVSFVEDHQVNVYHPQHAIDPTIANMVGAQVEEERPGITIYY